MVANLEMIKEAVEHNTPVTCEIKEVWIDLGAGWKDQTIVVYSKIGSYQLLNPREVEEANSGILSMSDLEKIIDRINQRGW